MTDKIDWRMHIPHIYADAMLVPLKPKNRFGHGQTGIMLAYASLSGAGSASLFLDGTAEKMVLEDNMAWTFKGIINAFSADFLAHTWTFSGVIRRQTGAANTAIYGATVTALGGDLGPPSAPTLAADTTNGALQITVNGVAGKDINYLAKVEVLEMNKARPKIVLNLTPTADTFTRESLPSTNFGTGTSFLVEGSTGARQIGLLRFDLAALAGTTVTNAELQLYASSTFPATALIEIYRILAANSAWTETTATWNLAHTATPWAGDTGADGGVDAGCSVSGTDYSSTIMGSYQAANEPVDGIIRIPLNPTEFTEMVNANHGLAIVSPTSAALGFRAREYADATKRPLLVIKYR